MQISLHSVSLPRDTAWDLCSGSFGGKKKTGRKTGKSCFCFEALNRAALSRSGTEAFKSAPLFPQKAPYVYEAGGKCQWKKTALMEGWGNEKDKWCVCAFREKRGEKYRKALKWTHAQWSLSMMLLAIGARMLCEKETFSMRSIYCHGLLEFPYFACFFMFNMKDPCISPMMDVYIKGVFIFMPSGWCFMDHV